MRRHAPQLLLRTHTIVKRAQLWQQAQNSLTRRSTCPRIQRHHRGGNQRVNVPAPMQSSARTCVSRRVEHISHISHRRGRRGTHTRRWGPRTLPLSKSPVSSRCNRRLRDTMPDNHHHHHHLQEFSNNTLAARATTPLLEGRNKRLRQLVDVCRMYAPQ
jgi:hypothetical protein